MVTAGKPNVPDIGRRGLPASAIQYPNTLGSGFDGVMNVKNEKGEVLDLVGTYEKQSYWNSKAALLSGVAGLLAVLTWSMTPLCKYMPAWNSLCA